MTMAGASEKPYAMTADQTLGYGWKSFCLFIIHTARFVFYKAKKPSYDQDQHDEMNPVDILEALGSIVKRLGLVDTLPLGEKIFRVRITRPVQHLGYCSRSGSSAP